MNTTRESSIKYIEEISLNAWPSYRIELYDGWLIRQSHNYTHRTNSVEQVGSSTIPLPEKISYCEEVYRRHGTPCIFKINPLIDPSFEGLLAERQYSVCHVTQVMTADLDQVQLMSEAMRSYETGDKMGLPTFVCYQDPAYPLPGGGPTVLLSSSITDEWIRGLFHLNGTSDPLLRRIVPSMFKAIPKDTIAASVEMNGSMVASGLGILDREYIGIYAIYVSPGVRRMHLARAIVSTLLRQGRELGAVRSYLQVVRGNEQARSLYSSLGYTDFYTYWFRSKPHRG